VLVMLLAPLTLSGVGAMIGVLSPNQQVAGVISNLALVVVMFLSPILVPASALPGVLRVTGALLPPTYAADALRRSLQGQLSSNLLIDISIMLMFAVGSIYLVTSRLDWRSR
jgi:ABC-2 type transport system permease protein